MIKPEIYYTLICDRCKELFESSGINGYTDDGSVLENAMESDWIEYEGKHYCPECYHVDEEMDELVPLPDFPRFAFKVKDFLECYVGFRDAVIQEQNDSYTISVGLKSERPLQREHLSMVGLLLPANVWSYEVTPANKYGWRKLVIKIEK